jgi:hypothetical protein
VVAPLPTARGGGDVPCHPYPTCIVGTLRPGSGLGLGMHRGLQGQDLAPVPAGPPAAVAPAAPPAR